MAETLIQNRRLIEADRTAVIPAEGELLYATDTKRLYIGDGTTAGGIPVGGTFFITEDMTLNVPSDYADINEALGYLASFRIKNTATVTIQVADGVYTYTETILVKHPDAQFIRIIGNESDPDSCEIKNPLQTYIIHVERCNLGYLGGFKLNGAADPVNYPEGVGVERRGLLVYFNASVMIGSMSAVNCHYGIHVYMNSVIRGVNITLSSNSHSGLIVQFNSSASFDGSCSCRDNAFAGVYVHSNSAFQSSGTGTEITSNDEYGIYILFNSIISVTNITVTGNTKKDIYALNASYARVTSSTYGTLSPALNAIGNSNSIITG
ncbi:right-handed parallel beta-helix repeat-containing protein [Geovibrio thiophilus]|uniref:Right-handed parallel beta-helix repeat-containing protein n=1 Tax=Geovibrio thiophilus TaxID=139438 RepID=A0A410JW11_9BACT|nr:right-handed parallel beta-helix repeat-containing protein [Geovibrio thiophilus]QAR32343.1 right-handed parallel beta-helix repeat-containing protein [Geovibrio thiophilus]